MLQRVRTSLDAPTPLAEALRSCKRHFAAAAVFSALLNLLYLAPTLYMLQIYDRVVTTGGKLTLLFITLALLLALGALSMLDMVRSRLLVRAGIRLDRRLTGAVLDAKLGQAGAKARATEAVREVDSFRQTLTGPGIIALFDAPWAIIYILVCFLIHPVLGLTATLGGAILLAITILNERATHEPLKRANERAAATYALQEQTVAGAEVIRAMGMRQAVVRRQIIERSTMTSLQAGAHFAAGGYITLTRFFRLLLQSLSLGIGAWLAVENQISPGAIFAASFLIARAVSPIEQVLGAWRSLATARDVFHNLTELFEREEQQPKRTLLPAPTGQLAVTNLSVVDTDHRLILNNINFAFEAGQIIGVLGPSGAGKTTLLRMIVGAGAPDRGSVRLDGADRKDWDPELLGRHIGYVPQESALFAGTIKDNICRFRNAIDLDQAALDDAVIEAARSAGVHDLILSLPHGYDTELGLGGTGLSAGQRQRIALARALFGSPALLVLDEPNAHLDSDGETRLAQTLIAHRRAGRSALVSAQRAGIVGALDKILVLRDGSLEAFGPRDEVLAKLRPERPSLNGLQTATSAPTGSAAHPEAS